MSFQIVGLRKALFTSFMGMSDSELARCSVVRKLAQRTATCRFPCRISLQDAEVGEPVLLINFTHLDVRSPYRSSYAIYVREQAEEACLAINKIPEVMEHRPLSLRSFNVDGMLIDAGLAQDTDLVPTIERMLDCADADYLHVHNAKQGCFVARVNRAA